MRNVNAYLHRFGHHVREYIYYSETQNRDERIIKCMSAYSVGSEMHRSNHYRCIRMPRHCVVLVLWGPCEYRMKLDSKSLTTDAGRFVCDRLRKFVTWFFVIFILLLVLRLIKVDDECINVYEAAVTHLSLLLKALNQRSDTAII